MVGLVCFRLDFVEQKKASHFIEKRLFTACWPAAALLNYRFSSSSFLVADQNLVVFRVEKFAVIFCPHQTEV